MSTVASVEPVPADPAFTVARGNPTDDEVAAVVAVLTAMTRPPDRARPDVDSHLVGGWTSYWRTVRGPLHAGHVAWRHSYR